MGQFAAADAVENVRHLLRLTSVGEGAVGEGAGTAAGYVHLRRRGTGGHGAEARENEIGLVQDTRRDQCLSQRGASRHR
jgi:hypothetical protein